MKSEGLGIGRRGTDNFYLFITYFCVWLLFLFVNIKFHGNIILSFICLSTFKFTHLIFNIQNCHLKKSTRLSSHLKNNFFAFLFLIFKIFTTKTRFFIEYQNEIHFFCLSARRLFNVADARHTKQINTCIWKVWKINLRENIFSQLHTRIFQSSIQYSNACMHIHVTTNK